MKHTILPLPDLKLFEPSLFADERGGFYESFNLRAFVSAVGDGFTFVQDNHSISRRGVVRGLHYQVNPYAQGKLVRVVTGEIFDVAVDIRRSSHTFGQWLGLRLSADNRKQLWIPPGFAHGFAALTDEVQVVYKTTAYYAAASERCIAWNDPAVGVEWPITAEPILSAKDQLGVPLASAETFD